jgi:hypothetical protein
LGDLVISKEEYGIEPAYLRFATTTQPKPKIALVEVKVVTTVMRKELIMGVSRWVRCLDTAK